MISTAEIVTDIAQRINAEHRLATTAAQSTLEHACEAGRLLHEAKAQCGHGAWLGWLQDNFEGSARTAQAYMRVAERWPAIEAAANAQGIAHLSFQEALRLVAEPNTSTAPHVTHNSGEHEWYTQACVIEAARTVLGGIDLDPASCPTANEVVKATRFYTKDDDGLAQPWRGRVWLNPPYSQPLISQFADKLLSSLESGDVIQAIWLSNNSSETRFFQSLASKTAGLCFPRGRIRCWQPGRESPTPLQGQVVIYFGHDAAKFMATFGHLGICLAGREAVQ